MNRWIRCCIGLALAIAGSIQRHTAGITPAPAAPMRASATSRPSRWIQASNRRSRACALPARPRCLPAKATPPISRASPRRRKVTISPRNGWTTGWCSRSATNAAAPAHCRWPARPALSVFEVDPRDRPDRGQGPTLYKEWKLSAPAAGSGVFQPGIAPRQLLTLILQGGGNSCTSADRFFALDAGDAGPESQLHLVRCSGDDEIAAVLGSLPSGPAKRPRQGESIMKFISPAALVGRPRADLVHGHRRGLSGAETGQLDREGFQIPHRRHHAGVAAALHHDRRADRAAGAGAARHRRLGRQHADAGLRRRVVRRRPAAGCHEILHHHPRQHRPRQILQAVRRHEDDFPEIQLRRHGRRPVPPGQAKASASSSCGW